MINDLASGGIPRLAASDIFKIVEEEIRRSEAPLAIFWDLDSMSTGGSSCGEVTARLKLILAHRGELVQFRGYTGFGMDSIGNDKRQELQHAGCDVIDVSHYGATCSSYIIVDAMKFAFTNKVRASLCFVTSSIDTYLLHNLQNPNWRTIMISNESPQSVLQKYCNVMVNWDHDVLQLQLGPPPGFMTLSIDALTIRSNQSKLPAYLNSVWSSEPKTPQKSLKAPSLVIGHDDTTKSLSTPDSINIDKLTKEEITMLRNIVKNNKHVGGHAGNGTLKSQVGSLLSSVYKIGERGDIQNFLSRAVYQGVVIEVEFGDEKFLFLPEDSNHIRTLHISTSLPIPWEKIPKKVRLNKHERPIAIFMKRGKLKRDKIPEAFIQATREYIILLFRSEHYAQLAVNANPWILSGTAVNLNFIGRNSQLRQASRELDVSASTFICPSCGGLFPEAESFLTLNTGGCLCRSCYILSDSWSPLQRSKGIGYAVSMLELLEEYDDIYVRSSLIRKIMAERWSTECASRGQVALWIEEAVKDGRAIETKAKLTSSKKVKIVCLPRNFNLLESAEAYTSAEMPTILEENFVTNLLRESGAPYPRKEMIQKLKNRFPRMMDDILLRNKLFMNAALNGKFFVAKGPYDQFVALSQDDAAASLGSSKNASTPIANIMHRDRSGISTESLPVNSEASSVGSETFDLERLLHSSRPNYI